MANPQRPLEGVRILELGPYVALPMTGRILASLGAEVIKVETNKVLDEMNFIPAWSRGGGQPEFQRAKKRITIDVRTPDGMEVFKELVKVSDVFMTNFRRNILDRWGIDFPELRRLSPALIILWQPGLAGIGPYYTYKSYVILVQHMGGVSLMSGEEGEPPATINTSYSDYHTGVFQPVAIMGALLRRRLPGQPATMESSIFKSGAVTAGPPLLDYQSNGRTPQRIGNRDQSAAPHGGYQCQGEDRGCAIAVRTEEEWTAFRRCIGDPNWCQESEFASLESRLANQDRLDELVGQWTACLTAEDAMAQLQAAGVPASVVSQGQDLHQSEHLKAREFYRETPFYLADRSRPAYEWEGGTGLAAANPPKLSESPMDFGYYSNIGEDNQYVFKEVLGMSDAEITRLTENQSLY